MDIAQVLLHLRPGEEWSLSDNNYEKLEWFSKTSKPSLQEISDQWPSVQVKLQAVKNDAIINGQINDLAQQYLIASASGDQEAAQNITNHIQLLKLKLSKVGTSL